MVVMSRTTMFDALKGAAEVGLRWADKTWHNAYQ